MLVIESPASNRNRTNIRLFVSFDDDSVPKVQWKVPPEPVINEPEAHPASALVGTPAPLYASDISAQPFLPLSAEVQVELSGIQTKQPPYVPTTVILKSDTLERINSTWKYCAPVLPEE